MKGIDTCNHRWDSWSRVDFFRRERYFQERRRCRDCGVEEARTQEDKKYADKDTG